MSDIIYITEENSNFFKTEGGFIGLKLNGEVYNRVSVVKPFPFSHSNDFLSVVDPEDKEIGIIKDYNTLSDSARELIDIELSRRYFLPEIKSIYSIKDEFGYSYWEVLTNLGPKKYTTRNNNSSFINIKDNLILIVDVDGNRFKISDYTTLDKRSLKFIELML